MPVLALLQFQWVGRVSDAEQERMRRNVEIAAGQFREAFDREIISAFRDLAISSVTARDSAWDRYAVRYDDWANNTSHPGLVRSVYLVHADGGKLGLRRWDNTRRTFVDIDWPAVLAPLEGDFQSELIDFNSGQLPDRTNRFRDVESPTSLVMVSPFRGLIPVSQGSARTGTRPQTSLAVFGFTVVELDISYIQKQVLPELAQRHFNHSNVDTYRLTVVDSDDPNVVIYRTDDDAPIDLLSADVTQPLITLFPGFRGQARDVRTGGLRSPAATPAATAPADEIAGRWRLLVQHQSGSLDAAVAGARKRNLGLSFGILLLLTVSIGLLTVSSRRAQRLARLQMEFVAGVSHELRTPVAVIRSAAENLSQGVVGNADRVKRYGQMIEGEARRLGEMVERVLQYAGIESGLGYGARAPLAPGEIVESAVGNVLPLLGPDKITIERQIPDALPPVIGDAAALRSAVQNLVANAVKYGGADRWVGIKAEHVRQGRTSEVRITVSDHGPGIPPNELPHIFDPFYRGGDAMAQQIHGNGLGLSLVKRIVNAHGGQVSVVTRPGMGSAFTIALPAAEPDPSSSSVASSVRAAVHP
jgi:signal transduction histidine kinase